MSHSKNPRGKPHLRRIQAIFNSKYAHESSIVEVIDWARSALDDSGVPVSDRTILGEALIALAEKYKDGFQPPPRSQDAALTEQITRNLSAALTKQFEILFSALDAGGQNWKGVKEQIHKSLQETISNVVSTAHLTGESVKLEEDDDDPTWI